MTADLIDGLRRVALEMTSDEATRSGVQGDDDSRRMAILGLVMREECDINESEHKLFSHGWLIRLGLQTRFCITLTWCHPNMYLYDCNP